jgi:hypothetical protein
VVQATCHNPADPNYFHECIIYMEYNQATAKLRLIQQKIVTATGVFTIEEAFGLNNEGDG